MHLSVFIDLYTPKIVDYSLKNHMKTSLILDIINIVASNKKLEPTLFIHLDQGIQYLSYDFLTLVKKNSIIAAAAIKIIYMTML